MKSSERRHLQTNEFAIAVSRAQTWFEQNRTTVLGGAVAVAIVAASVLGYTAWQRSVNTKAATLLAEAMVIAESGVQPPAPPAGTTNDPTNPGGQLPGSYPTLDAKLNAALPKFMAAADAYPNTAAGQTARLHAAETLAQMGRRDEAIQQYDQLIGSGNALVARSARLGKASVQIVAGQYDPAIAMLKEMAAQADSPLPADALLMELARAYRLAGKTDDARKTLTQVVEQHADSPYASDAKVEIAKLKG